jgi:FMN phosphatase YigB (HAD superfamily)
MEKKLILSTLPKTWIFDLDGTIVKHNGYKLEGKDTLLKGAKEYIQSIPAEDKIVLLTSRTDAYKAETIRFLKLNFIRFDEILFNMPMGERIVINDRKPSGIDMAIAINCDRDSLCLPEIAREK